MSPDLDSIPEPGWRRIGLCGLMMATSAKYHRNIRRIPHIVIPGSLRGDRLLDAVGIQCGAVRSSRCPAHGGDLSLLERRRHDPMAVRFRARQLFGNLFGNRLRSGNRSHDPAIPISVESKKRSAPIRLPTSPISPQRFITYELEKGTIRVEFGLSETKTRSLWNHRTKIRITLEDRCWV